MKKIYRFYILLAAAAVLSFASGCLNESSVSGVSYPPSYNSSNDHVLPYVTSNPPALTVLPYSTTGPITTDTTKRVEIVFSELMDASTITAANVYIRNVQGDPAVITGQTVTLGEDMMTAFVEWTNATDYSAVPLEAVVLSAVTDRAGNRLAGMASPRHFGDSYPYNETVSDFRSDVGGDAPAWTNTPDWRNITVTLSKEGWATATATEISITATFNTSDITSVTASNFTTTGGTITNFLYAAGVATFDVTGLTQSTEYTITFNPDGVGINPAVVSGVRRYPNGTTALGTLTGSDVLDDYDLTKGNRSSYTLPFVMYYDNATVIPPVISAVTDYTAAFYPGYGNTWRVAGIQFSDTIDAATVVSENFIVFNNSGDRLLFDVAVFYVDGDVDPPVRIYISTMNYSQEAIDQIIIKSDITFVGLQIDGDGDHSFEGDGDYDQDGVVDDWVVIN